MSSMWQRRPLVLFMTPMTQQNQNIFNGTQKIKGLLYGIEDEDLSEVGGRKSFWRCIINGASKYIPWVRAFQISVSIYRGYKYAFFKWKNHKRHIMGTSTITLSITQKPFYIYHTY